MGLIGPGSRRLAMLAILLAVFAGSAAAGDVIHLKGGGEIRGEILSETDEVVKIRLAIGGSMDVLRSRIREIVRGQEEAKPAAPERRTEATDSFLIYEGGTNLVGWRQVRSYRRDDARLYESETVFVGEDAKPLVRVHIVETVAGDGTMRSFNYREKTGDGPERVKRGEVVGEVLNLTETFRGKVTRSSIPIQKGSRLPSAARAFVLERLGDLKGELETPVIDPVTGTVVVIRWTVGKKETMKRGGKEVEVKVIRATKNDVTSVERLDSEGRTISVELNGPSLVAVAVGREKIAKMKSGKGVESRVAGALQNTHLDREAGFSIDKPDATWAFEPGSGMCLVTLKHAKTFSYVDVLRDTSVPKGTQLETLALNVQRWLAANSEKFTKESDGYAEAGGERAYHLVAHSIIKGEEIRTRVVAVIHDDVAWIVAASCPAAYFKRLGPIFERIVASLEFAE
jgi:hypothetical protein